MGGIGTEILVIILLLVLNGVFAMSELAVVTARKVRLEQRAEEGDPGAGAALAIAHEPTQFLSTVQVGITLIGVLAGAFGGATISEQLAVGFRRVPALAGFADGLSLAIVVGVITFLSLVLGELAPKRIALGNPERIAAFVARPMGVLSRIVSPLVTLLTGSTNLVLRVIGIRVSTEPGLTEEEIRAIVEQGAEAGVVQVAEHEMVEGVFRLGERLTSDVMTPRTQLEWVDVSQPPDAVRRQLADQARPRYLVCDETVENVLGVLYAEDVVARCLSGDPLDVRAMLSPPLYVPGSMPALALLENFRRARRHVAVVLDEYGGLQGIVELEDLVGSVMGDVPRPDEPIEQDIVRRDGRTWLLAGTAALEDVEAALDLPDVPADERRGVRTIGGFVMALLGRVPSVGDVVESGPFRLEVAEMDGRRIVRVQAVKTGATRSAAAGPQDDNARPEGRI